MPRHRFTEDERMDVLLTQLISRSVNLKDRLTCVPSYVLATCRLATCRAIWYLPIPDGQRPAYFFHTHLHLLVCTRVTAQDVEHNPRVLQGLAAVVALYQTHHLWRPLSFILQAPDLNPTLTYTTRTLVHYNLPEETHAIPT